MAAWFPGSSPTRANRRSSLSYILLALSASNLETADDGLVLNSPGGVRLERKRSCQPRGITSSAELQFIREC